MISRFRVKNYKALRDIDIPLTPIHVIIGQNDSGKTSLLEAILAFCRSSDWQFTLAEAFGGDWNGIELLTFGSTSPVIELSAQLNGSYKNTKESLEYGFAVSFIEQERSCLLAREWSANGTIKDFSRNGEHKTSVSDRIRRSLSSTMNDDLLLIGNLIPKASSLYRFNANLMKTPAAIDLGRVLRMDADGFGLSTLLDDILGNDPAAFLNLSKEFCEYFPQFKSVRLQTQKGVKREYNWSGVPSTTTTSATGKGIYFETQTGSEIRTQQVSDGAILFLGFLALSYLPQPPIPKILLIEEPETGVYPKRLAEIVRILKRLVEKKGDREVPQIIFTTHSPYVLSEFTPEEVTVMSRVGDSVIARPLRDAPNIEKRLGGGEFYLGELWYNLDEEELFQNGRSASHH